MAVVVAVLADATSVVRCSHSETTGRGNGSLCILLLLLITGWTVASAAGRSVEMGFTSGATGVVATVDEAAVVVAGGRLGGGGFLVCFLAMAVSQEACTSGFSEST